LIIHAIQYIAEHCVNSKSGWCYISIFFANKQIKKLHRFNDEAALPISTEGVYTYIFQVLLSIYKRWYFKDNSITAGAVTS